MSTAVEGAQGKNDCPVGCVGALMVGLLGVGKGVLVGVRDWGGDGWVGWWALPTLRLLHLPE